MQSESIKMTLILAQLVVAVTTDVRCYKVKNEINLFFAFVGVLFNAMVGAEAHLPSAFLGIIMPFIILLPLYLLKMLGAGDIKLFCAIGALVGLKDILWSMALTFLFGFFVALLIMVARRNFLERFKKLYIYLKGCLLSMSIMPYYPLSTDNSGKMHFTIPITLGTIAASLL